MGTALTLGAEAPESLRNIEENLNMLVPRFDAVLSGSNLDSKRLIQTLLISCEKNNKLLKCTRSSLVSSAMSFASLRLPVDGASGQGFILPFKEVAQPCIGYKGYNTIGARSGITITAGTVREDDLEWDYLEGVGGFIRHKRRLDSKAPIIAFWALATSNFQPPIPSILGIGQVTDVMQRSPAVKFGADTPWKDPTIGFPAMGEKTARRRLSRSMPWDVDDGRFLLAARMDEAWDEQGKHAYIDNGTVQVEGEGPRTPMQIAQEQKPQRTADELMQPRTTALEATLRKAGDEAASRGTEALKTWFLALPAADKRVIEAYKDSTLKTAADKADKAIAEKWNS